MAWEFQNSDRLIAGNSKLPYGYEAYAFVTFDINAAVQNPEDATDLQQAIDRAIDMIQLALDVIAAKRNKEEDKETKDGSG